MTAIDPAESLEERIRRRAYELYEQSGREEGRAEEHWVEAEAQVQEKTGLVTERRRPDVC
jgi:hypothetical protein